MSGAILLAHGGGSWDLSTYVYTSKNLSVGAQTSAPGALRLSEDGTKAYVADQTNDRIYQYTLSTPFDISTGSYASKYLDATSQTALVFAFTISRDGSKFYVVDHTAKIIYQYNLSTPWDVSTASYASKSYDASARGTNIYGIFLSPDGTKMLCSDLSGATANIYQYTLSTPYDVSTASYDSKSLNITSATIMFDFYIKNDGTRIFYSFNSNIQQRSMSTPWDISTAGSVENTENVSSDTEDGIHISQDGLNMYITAAHVFPSPYAAIYQYSLD